MNYILMHKDIPVSTIDIDEKTGYITKIYETFCPEHIPVGVGVKKGITVRSDLNDWWKDRSIPSSRSGLKKALDILGAASPTALLTRSYGLSLSDQYWVKPENSYISWSGVNFFENTFSPDIGDILSGKPVKKRDIDFLSPDITLDGNLRKRWIIKDGKRCLIKAGSLPYFQQSFNEVTACAVMRRLGIPYTEYALVWEGNEPCCICDDFISPDTELVTAWQIMLTHKQLNHISRYRHFTDCCEKNGIGGMVQALNCMITVDYIIANEDRHLNNFGVIRNADTLEWKGFVPVFDSGTSLGYELTAAQIRGNAWVECKPFKKNHSDQLKLVTSFDWLDFSKLDGIGEEICDIFTDGRAAGFIDSKRISAIAHTVENRIEYVRETAYGMYSGASGGSTGEDVTEDIARSYDQ